MEIEERIAGMAGKINIQTAILARDAARQIKNVWIREDGKPVTVEDPLYLDNKVKDDKKVLCDMLRTLDTLVEERDAGSQVSDTVLCAAERRDGVYGDASETE